MVGKLIVISRLNLVRFENRKYNSIFGLKTFLKTVGDPTKNNTMTDIIKIKKGLDISLKGKAFLEVQSAGYTENYALCPADFHGLIPRVLVREGEQVLAGTPLMADKNKPEILFVSPLSGVISAVKRGEKRKLLAIEIRSDQKNAALSYPVRNPLDMEGVKVKEALLEAGLWPYIKRRPYDVIANPRTEPKAIFVSAFDTAPLAPDYAFILKGQGHDFQTGLNALTKLTAGKVHLSIPADSASAELKSAQNVEIHRFQGPHPAGNVGVQINHINPVNKGETVWTVNALDVLFIGRLFNRGRVDFSRLVALTGPEVYEPRYYRCVAGIQLSALFKGNVHKEIPLRYISGNPLTGTRVEINDYLGAYDSQVTVLHEGSDVHEFAGWVMPRLNMFSMSKTYFSGLIQMICPRKQFDADTRILGGERALIMSGEYEKVFPMDILPEKLVRACITRELEKMEELGIYEVAPEDFALCEYVCTSKVEVQKQVRAALDLLKAENGEE